MADKCLTVESGLDLQLLCSECMYRVSRRSSPFAGSAGVHLGVPATEKWRDEWQSIRCTCGSEEWKSYTHLIQVSLAEPKRTDFLCSLWRGSGSTCLESKIARASDQQQIHQLKLSHLYSREKRL